MDKFKEMPATLTSPATGAAAVAPDDAQLLDQVTRAIYVGNTGDVSVEMADGQNIVFANVQGGTVLAIRSRRVRLTGTTASGIVALW